MIKQLTLCADDFAQSPEISQGILNLLDMRRLSATSVLSQSPHWPALAPQLKKHDGAADIGLHLNLTHPFDDSAQPLAHWLMNSQLRKLSRPKLLALTLLQIDRFAEQFGRLPDFIDGHQHVHALPVVRDALLQAIEQRWQNQPLPYLRAPDNLRHPGDNRLKAMVLRSLCTGFGETAQKQGLRITPWFGGAYSLTASANYPGLMQSWLSHCPDHALIMCHPGLPSTDQDDPIRLARVQEYHYLASDAFLELCQQQQVILTRW